MTLHIQELQSYIQNLKDNKAVPTETTTFANIVRNCIQRSEWIRSQIARVQLAYCKSLTPLENLYGTPWASHVIQKESYLWGPSGTSTVTDEDVSRIVMAQQTYAEETANDLPLQRVSFRNTQEF
jgi:hypothetical protein